jgi:hypothetical protein
MKSPSAEERLEEARKKAREVVQRIVDSRNPGVAVWVQNSFVDSIAQALLEAERKGMERMKSLKKSAPGRRGKAMGENKQEERTYTVTKYCGNCGHKFDARFKRGEVARDVECPRCGVSPADLYRDSLRPRL